MLLFLYFLALVTCTAFAVPATAIQSQLTFSSTTNTTETSLSLLSTQHSDSLSAVLFTHLLSNTSTLFFNPTDAISSQPTQPNGTLTTVNLIPLSIISSSLPPSSATSMSTPTPSTTILVTEVTTVFETTTLYATPPPTASVTVDVSETATATATPSPSWDDLTVWTAAPQMTDLSAFNVTHFPSGQQNLDIVAQIPAEAISPTAQHLHNPLDTMSTILQLVYPAHSVNPASKPEGGADFYATPLNLTGARNVTLEYRVFFPADFDWVKGGKLPGLYGGHTGCSGGASARDCFSTRMMWRQLGAGELYLYAPKDKQTDALCADAASVCDAAYGFSVGRGSFNFTAGDWTYLRQNVVLNTPGQTDGTFMLFVDGRTTINRTDVFYRDAVQQSKHDDTPRATAEFIGLFFSTFFGGHGKKYATPREQYTWFKDFAITRHD